MPRRANAPTAAQEAIGPVCFLAAGALVLSASAAPSSLAGKMVFLSHRVVALPQSAAVLTSDRRAINALASPVLYARGADDLLFVLGWTVILTGLRFIVQSVLLKPLARACGRTKRMTVHKFAENGWQVIYYACAFCTGLSIQFGTDWWFFGEPDWNENLWRGYGGEVLHRPVVKAYYLIQLAFWVSMIFVTLVEPWRSDIVPMMLHHFITSFMVGGSYSLDQIRVGTAVLVEQDFADVFLPLAKCFKYIGLPGIGDVVFAIFAVSWYPTRHGLFFYIYASIINDYPAHCTPDVNVPGWEPEAGYYNHAMVRPVFLTFLALFQCLLLRWGLWDIGPAVWKAVTSGEDVDDHRSGPDTDDEKDKLKPE